MAGFHDPVDDERDALRNQYAGLDLTTLVSMHQPFPVRGGGYSDIYRGILTDANCSEATSVALKVLRVSILPGLPEVKLKIVKRLRQEISIWRRLQHPNVQPLRGLWWHDGWTLPAMVSTWEENGNLIDYLRVLSQSMPERDLHDIKLTLIIDALRGLSYLHGQQVIHADIKGVNVLVSSEGTALLCDFGISWTSIKSSISFSLRQSTLGTDVFLAPELSGINESLDEEESVPYSFASDVWSFGCLFFEVITGRAPWHGKSYAQVIVAQSKKSLFSRPANMDDQHWDLVRLCCAFNVEDRPTANAILPRLTILFLRVSQ